jgi:glycosyltransferase involved in cell wall biosynthesis
VGAGRAAPDGAHIEAKEWNEASEPADVREFDIGIMPLRDDPWSRGKCGFKLIQYLASGVPAVASPVGVNRRIVDDGRSGYLCTTDDEWVERLIELVDNRDLRQRMAAAGREDIRREWSLQRWGPVVAGLLAQVARPERRPA